MNGVGFSGTFSPRMRPFVSSATMLTALISASCGRIDLSTEPFQTNSIRNPCSRGLTIMRASRYAACAASPADRCISTGIDFDVGVLQTSPTLSSGTSGFVSG